MTLLHNYSILIASEILTFNCNQNQQSNRGNNTLLAPALSDIIMYVRFSLALKWTIQEFAANAHPRITLESRRVEISNNF